MSANDEGQGRRRSAAEWTSLAVAVIVLALVVVGLIVQIGHGDDPADPVVSVGAARTVPSGAAQVPVEVRNDGDRAAVGVVVSATLTAADGTTQTADQTIDFLGAAETARLVFSFDDDPAAGELEVTIGGFAEP